MWVVLEDHTVTEPQSSILRTTVHFLQEDLRDARDRHIISFARSLVFRLFFFVQ